MARTKQRYRSEVTEEISIQTYRTGIYVRLSKERTETWRNKSQSLDTQESLARTFAKEHGLSVVICYVDYEYSGTNFNRPAFQEMMENIKKGSINCILIRDLSRLGRDYIEMGRLIDKVFPFLGVRFISINDQLDTLHGLEEKKFFEVEIKNLVNDLYSKDISKKVTAHNIHQASQGYYIGGFAPYGYQLVKHEQGIKLAIDPLVKPILDLVFKILLEGSSLSKVTNYLNQQQIAIPTSYRRTGQLYRTEEDTKMWRGPNLLRLVQNPVYLGHLVQRKTNKNLSAEEYVRFEYAHESYLTQDEYDKMVSLFRNRKHVWKSAIPKTPNRYKGLLYARGSSTQMYRYCKHFSGKKSDYDYYYFMDYVYDTATSNKQSVYISEQMLDKMMIRILQDEMVRLGNFETLLSSLEKKKEQCIATYQKQATRHHQTIMHLRVELGDLYASYSLFRESQSDYLAQKSEKYTKIETLSTEITNCDISIRQVEVEYQRQVLWLKNLFKEQQQIVLTEDLLSALIERIEVDVDKNITVTFYCQIGGD